MKKLFWLAAGITVGMIAAKEIEKNPKAKAAYTEVTARVRTLAQAFVEGYEEESKPAAPTSKRAAAPKTAN